MSQWFKYKELFATMHFIKRKLKNALEYLHPAHVKAVMRGESAERRKAIRHQLRPQPSPHQLKQDTVRDYARQHHCRVLIETGTFKGDMIHAMLADFDRLYSIELSHSLYLAAKERFKDCRTVFLFEGDSEKVLPQILNEINEPAVFWLDAHTSGGETARGRLDTPIEKELVDILNHPVKSHVILIDDAREFGIGKHYPMIKRLQKLTATMYKQFEVNNDIIRITK
jgi:hypothetical protein